jgi:type I restriction enzyme R subunit
LPSRPEKESVVRIRLIDKQLLQAGWSSTNGTLLTEFPLKQNPESPSTEDQFADYVLLSRDGRILAIVEAKRNTRDALAGKRQAADYADFVRRQNGQDPFIFLANALPVTGPCDSHLPITPLSGEIQGEA